MSKKKPKTIGASYPLSFMGCEGEVIVEMTPTEAVSMIEKAWQENKRLRQENATLTAERDEARRLLKAVVDITLDNMVHDANPKHLCDFVHRPDIAMCKVCEDWTDAMVMCYPDDFQDKEDGK